MATNGKRDPGYTMVCNTEHGQIILSFGGKTYTLKGVPVFGVLRRLQEGAEAIAKREDDNRAGFDLMQETLEWWRYAAETLGVKLPPVDEMPMGLALLGPQQEALTHWLICSVPTQAPGRGPQANGTTKPRGTAKAR